jgi:lipopolysaccharide transport system ATP-binding protein
MSIKNILIKHITAAGLKSFMFNLPKYRVPEKVEVCNLNRCFEVKKGETFGIIGRNGSGKSTILSLMAGVIRQDRGRIETHGKISSLLELGAGFHPDLSGMENIILNGILMGHTREEVMGKIDGIREFSELGDFIYQPLRTYSSGMQVRLGFSVAVHIAPEILLVDEALAVGDMSFQEKCLKRMEEFKKAGATIIMVTHDMVTVDKLCDRAAWIESGGIAAIGKPKDVVMKYKNTEQGRSFREDRMLWMKSTPP